MSELLLTHSNFSTAKEIKVTKFSFYGILFHV